MSRFKNTAEIRTYDDPANTQVRIDSHWNDNNMAVIKVGKEVRTVVIRDLKMALDNAGNVGI